MPSGSSPRSSGSARRTDPARRFQVNPLPSLTDDVARGSADTRAFAGDQLQPLVPPQVLHFRQVPFLTSV